MSDHDQILAQKNKDDVTYDSLLGGRVALFQPKDGYRAAIDPILLAAAVPAQKGQRILDLGAGSGAAALCLAARVDGVEVAGLELQSDLIQFAAMGAAESGLAGRVTFQQGDLLAPPFGIGAEGFDHVMANPPYHIAGNGARPPDSIKFIANVEGNASLKDWVRACLHFVRPKGGVTLIHRADRLDALLAAMHGHLGGIIVFPLWPGKGKPAKRVILQGRKGVSTPLRLAAGLTLHSLDGAYAKRAEDVLRHAHALDL